MNRQTEATGSQSRYHILLVEDNPGDVRLFEEAIRGVEIEYSLHVVSDGEPALEFLQQRGEYSDAPLPDIVLLDLNLPRKSGIDVLCELDNESDLSALPVVILSSSRDADDIRRAYECGANAYLTKPVNPVEFGGLVKDFYQFWFQSAHLPPTR